MTNPKTEPLGPNTCAYGMSPMIDGTAGFGSCSDETKTAVCWDSKGRPSCGKHHLLLTRGINPNG